MPTTDAVALAAICKRLRITPRAARDKLRAAYGAKGASKLPKLVNPDRWVFRPTDVKKIKTLLKA